MNEHLEATAMREGSTETGAPLLKRAYDEKSERYFSGARRDWIDRLPSNDRAVLLEIGCGNGSTGVLALEGGKCRRYCGVEISQAPAAAAKASISEVLVGNVETLSLPWPEATFDALLMSEVLEHLVDPWSVLRKLRPLLKPGALVFASSPNVSHHQIVRMILNNRWDLEDQGAMDRTHLRWFTPQSYRQMFEECGYRVDHVGPLVPLGKKARLLCGLMGGWGEHLFTYQIDLRAHKSE